MVDKAATRKRRKGVAATQEPPPYPEAVEALFNLLGKAYSATLQSRCLRAAEYYGRVASDARALWGDKGALCVVHALCEQSYMLACHAKATATGVGDLVPLWLEAHQLVAECRRILNARLSANTCLLGRCYAVEEDFYARNQLMIVEVGGRMELTSEQRAAGYVRLKRDVGYQACMETVCAGLRFAYPAFSSRKVQPLTGEERSETHAFALRCVGIMAFCGKSDGRFAELVRNLLASNHLEQPFKAELNRAWNRLALQNALRRRHVIEDEGADSGIKTNNVNISQMCAADRAKHGLRWCALPSCAKQETHVFDFKQCSACKAVVYCSAEHAALHWTKTHSKECASLKAAGTKPISTADAVIKRLRAHAPQLAWRVSLEACALVALSVGLVLLARAVMSTVTAFRFAH